MRYSKEENTYILAVFNSGDTVTIDIYRLSDNSKVVDGAFCSEIGSTGVFKYEFSQTITQKEEFLWIMNNGSYSKYGKIVLGGWMDNINNSISEHRNAVEPKIDTNISSRLASDDSRLDNLDAKVSSRSSHTPADVWSYSNRELTNPDNYKADVSDLAKESTVQEIKAKTDKLQFNTNNDVKATLDGEKVNLTDTTESQIDNIETNVTNVDQYKADVSNLAKESTLQEVKDKTDKLNFDENDFVKSTAQNPELQNLDEKVSTRASESTVQQIKSKTDKLQFNAENDIKATLDGEKVSLDTDTENLIRIILGLVQHNYRLFNTTYTTINGRKKLTSATVKIYNTKEDCDNDNNPIKTYTLEIQYDNDGYVIDYKSKEV